MVSPDSPMTRLTRSDTGGPAQFSFGGVENTTMLPRSTPWKW